MDLHLVFLATLVLCIVFLWIVNIRFTFRENNQVKAKTHVKFPSRRFVDGAAKFHVVFSTGCSPFQDWQSYTFFYHAWRSGQSRYGKVTRVASGCNEETAKALKETHQREIRPLSENFFLHLTPDYSKILPGTDYKFFNKPYGLRHWMEHGLGYNTKNSSHPEDDTIVVILDPDTMILRPFSSRNMDAVFETWVTPGPRVVKHGQPFSQLYGLSAWFMGKIEGNLTRILNNIEGYDESKERSNLYNWTSKELYKYYAAGPPYIATGKDMYKLVKTYAEVAVPVYELTEDHLSEMYAYSVAAGHLKLKHQLAHSFMVSNHEMEQEGFHLIDNWSSAENCAVDHPPGPLPYTLHYCQRYFLGPYFFSKYQLAKNILSCDLPLLAEPPPTIGDEYNSSVTPNGEFNKLSPRDRKRMTFLLCHIIVRLNEAIEHWRSEFCDPGTANLNRTYLFPLKTKKQ